MKRKVESASGGCHKMVASSLARGDAGMVSLAVDECLEARLAASVFG
jgi:hypothetical protein